MNKVTKVFNKIVDIFLTQYAYGFTGGILMSNKESEALKEELFAGIPEKELSSGSKRKLGLILNVHCNAGKSEIKKTIEKALKPINSSLDEIKKTQEAMTQQIKAFSDKAFGNGGIVNESSE